MQNLEGYKRIIHVKETHNVQPHGLKINGKVIDDSKSIPTKFNIFFD